VDCGPSEVKYFILRGEATFVVVKDQEQIDKLLEIKAEIPQVKKFIYWEPKGMEKYDDPHLIEFKDVIALGKEYEKTHPNLFDECVEKTGLNDTACFCFTSGTTGNPKPAVITYYTMIKWLEFPHNYWSLEENWDYFSFLCPAWLTDQWLGICGALIYDWVVNFPEEPETVKDDAREICGQFQFGGARAWEELNRNIQSNMIDADFIKRFCYKLFLPVGLRVADLLYENKNLVSS